MAGGYPHWKNTVFIIEHCCHPRKFCWQHWSRICALYLVLTLSIISESVSKLGWKLCPLYMIIQSHPALYLGLGFETQKPELALLFSAFYCIISLLRHREDGMLILPSEPATASSLLGLRGFLGHETFHLKTRKVPNNPGQFGHLGSKNLQLPRNAGKNTSLDILRVASTL